MTFCSFPAADVFVLTFLQIVLLEVLAVRPVWELNSTIVKEGKQPCAGYSTAYNQ